VVNVASGAHFGARLAQFDDLQSRRRYFSFSAYALSKLANVLFTFELARRLAPQGAGVTANVLHPGLVRTGFGSSNGPVWDFLYLFVNALALPPERGAETLVYLAGSPDVAGVTGTYFYQCRPARVSPLALDEALARRLWEESERLTGLEPERVSRA
jgi:NAD(P)-dependent dehydrogenase (short-subunit alcohol dehydrogenase family)